METIAWKDDINVFYVVAASFPEGIMDAHNTLRAEVPVSAGRRYFGVSRPEQGTIVYKAAAEETYDGEGMERGYKTMVLRKGQYISLAVKDYAKDTKSIERAFKQLLAQPGLDPNGYCVEWYLNDKDVQCMIRLAS